MSKANPKYSVGYHSVHEVFSEPQYKAVLYVDYGRRRGEGRGPEPLIETAYGGSKEQAAVALAHAALHQGFRPNALPKELAGAVLEAAAELYERAEEFLIERHKLKQEAADALLAMPEPKPNPTRLHE